MLFYKNGAFICLKTAKITNSACIACTIVPGLVELFFSQTCLTLTRNMNVKVAMELHYILYFPNYRNLDTGNFSLTLRIFPILSLEEGQTWNAMDENGKKLSLV